MVKLLLSDAINLHALNLYPRFLIPGACILVAILSLNFRGDGIRDAAAPDSTY